VKVNPAPEKTLRRDAVRNHARLVASARELFAERGVDVPVEEITHHAGLGMGTLYRHFPTKEDLIDAVLEDAFAEILRLAEEAAADEDAWRGLTRFLEHSLELHTQHRGVKDILAVRGHGAEHARRMRARIRPLLVHMVERAHAQGSLRSDFSAEDLPLVFWSVSGVNDATAAVAPEHWRRYLALLLDGLRAQGSAPLPGRPLTRPQLARIRGGGRTT
jgi:AcrR family transcriptional regulator